MSDFAQIKKKKKHCTLPHRQNTETSPQHHSPFFPLDDLKHRMMDLLAEAVQKGAGHIRDPIGGTNENLFV